MAQEIVTLRPVDYYVCEEKRRAMKRAGRNAGSQRPADRRSLPFCLDALSLKERGTLEQDLALAARVQQTLLPSRDFRTAGWQVHYHYAPAGLLSGDYCDLFESNSALLFLFGDVTGKGVAASMMMSRLHATFRSLADADPPLDLMVEAANRLLSQSTLASQFATLIAGRAARDGSVDLVNAGHLPLLRISKCGVRPEPATGVPLSVLADVRFPVRRFVLDLGDTLLAYTDGLTEAHNAAGEEYGIWRLENAAARNAMATPCELIAACLSDMLDFTSATEQRDDITLLAIRRMAQLGNAAPTPGVLSPEVSE
jgi:phosphoserine phosphatase RsbU/P